MNTNKKRRSRLAKVYTVKIREDITKMIERANHFALAERQVTLQTAIEVANRDLRRTVEMHPDRRAFSALKAVSAHIALASNNKYTSASLSNSDLLPVGHPMSTALHAMTSSALAHAQARWIAADRLIADDARALVASAYSLTPDSFERKHAFARLSATPNTSVPRMLTLDPIVAVGGFGLGGDSSAARSMRAKLQRRDRYGKFAFMGGGFSFNLRGLDGAFTKFGGRVAGAGENNTVEIEVKGHPTVPNGIYSLPAGKGVSSKAWLPESVDVKDSDSSTDLFVDESSLQKLDAPSGWDKQPTEPGAPELWTSKDGYFVTKDGDTLSLNRANSADNSIGEQVASSDSWADIQKAALGDQDDYEKALKEDEAFGPTKAKAPDSKVSTALKAGEAPEGWTTKEIASTDGVPTAWRHSSPDGQYFVTEDRDGGLGAKRDKAVEDRVPNFAVVRRNEDGSAGKTVGTFVNTWGGVDGRIKADSMQRAKEAPSAPDFISPEVGRTVLDDGLSKVESALGDIPEEDLDNLDEEDSEALNKVNDLLDSAREAIDSIDPVGSNTNDLRFDEARADLGEIAQILSESNNGDMQNAGFDLKETVDNFLALPQIDFGGGRAERASRETPAPKPAAPEVLNATDVEDAKDIIGNLYEAGYQIEEGDDADPKYAKYIDKDGNVAMGTKVTLPDGRYTQLEESEESEYSAGDWVFYSADGKELNRVDASEDGPERSLFTGGDDGGFNYKEAVKTLKDPEASMDDKFDAVFRTAKGTPAADRLPELNEGKTYADIPEGSEVVFSEYAQTYTIRTPDGRYAVVETGATNDKNQVTPDYVDSMPTEATEFLRELLNIGPRAGLPFAQGGFDDDDFAKQFMRDTPSDEFDYKEALATSKDPNATPNDKFDAIFQALDGVPVADVLKELSDGQTYADIPEGSVALFTAFDGDEILIRKPDGKYAIIALGATNDKNQVTPDDVDTMPTEAGEYVDQLLDDHDYFRGGFTNKEFDDTFRSQRTAANDGFNATDVEDAKDIIGNLYEAAMDPDSSPELSKYIDENGNIVAGTRVTLPDGRYAQLEDNEESGDWVLYSADGAELERVDASEDGPEDVLFTGEPPAGGPTLMPGDDGEPDDAGTRNLPSEQDYMDDPAIDAYIKSMDSYLAEEFDSMFETPDGAYKPDIFGAYEPKGKTIEDSADYTDDPEVLAGMFSDQELVLALRDAVLPLDGEDAPGRGALEFSDGPEFVSAEALYFAIDKKSGKGDMSLASIYDMELDPDREMTNADRIAMFEEDAKIDPLGGDEIAMPTTRDAEVLKAVDRNKEIGKPTKAQVATDLMLSHKEQNQSIIDIADDLIAKQDDGLGYDSFNLQDTLVKYLPWSVSSDSDEREAFSALWGMMMSLDGGASTEELTPESLGDPEAFRTIIYNSLLDIHGGDDTIAMDSYNELIDNFGGMPEFVAGKESIASGKDDLGSGTTAAAFYRLVSTSAKPNEKSIYRLVNVKNNDPLLEKYTTEGSLFGIDARSFTSTNIADGSLASSFFIPSDADDSRIIFEIAPGETKSIDASTISWFVGENEHFSFGNFEVVSVRKQKGRLKNDEYIVKIRSTDTKDVAAPTAEGISYSGIEDWKKVGGQMGSNVGGTFEDQDGNQYYVKIPKSPSHAQNESLASALYREAGIEAVEVNLGFSDGELRTISPLIPNSSTDLESRLDDAEYIKKLQEGFAVDAWLANWDVAGLTFDNVITDSNGDPVRVDPGGALMWRAQGAPKGKLFGDKVNEIDSLRDPDLNPTSAEVFGSMTDADISNSAAKLVGITPERIDSIVDSIVTDPNEAATLKERLKKRRNDILKRFAPKDNIFNENTPLPIEEDPNAPQPPSDPNDADAMSNYKDALADYEINKAVSDVWDCPPDGLTAAGDKTCTTPSVDELIDNVNSKADAVGVVDNSETADKILDDIIDFVKQVQSEELKPSTKKRAKEIAEEIAAIREGIADGSITNDQAIARLNTLSDSIPVGGTSDDANTLEVIGETIDDYRRILDGSFEDRPFSPNYPPAGSGSKGYAKDKTTFLTLGMRVRNKWGYAGVVDRYDKNSWQVWVTMDIDPSGQFAPGYKKMSFSTKTLDVIPEGGDDSPWIDLPGTPEGKKPKTGVTPTKVPPKGSPGEKYSKEIADKIAKSGKAAKPPKAEAPSGAPEAPENLNYEIDTGTPKSETPSTISKAEKATGEYAKENPGSKIYTDSRGGQLWFSAKKGQLGERRIFIHSVFVDEKSRRQGIAADLLDKLANDYFGSQISPGGLTKDGKPFWDWWSSSRGLAELSDPQFPNSRHLMTDEQLAARDEDKNVDGSNFPYDVISKAPEAPEVIGDEISVPDGDQSDAASRVPDDDVLIRLLSGGGSSDENVDFNKSWADHLSQYEIGSGLGDEVLKTLTDFLASLGGTLIDVDDKDVLAQMIDKKIMTASETDSGQELDAGPIADLLHGIAGFTSGAYRTTRGSKEDAKKVAEGMKNEKFFGDGGGYITSPAQYSGRPSDASIAEFWANFAKILDNPDFITNSKDAPKKMTKERLKVVSSSAAILLRALRVADPIEGDYTRVLHFMEDINDESHPLHYMLEEGKEVTLRPTSWMKNDDIENISFDDQDGIFQYGDFAKVDGALGDVLFTISDPRGLNARPLPNVWGEAEVILSGGRYRVIKVEKKEIDGKPYTRIALEDITAETKAPEAPDSPVKTVEESEVNAVDIDPQWQVMPANKSAKELDLQFEDYYKESKFSIDPLFNEDVTDEQERASSGMMAYQANDYFIINELLRGKITVDEDAYDEDTIDPVEYKATIEKIYSMDMLYKNAPTIPEDMVLYRGVHSSYSDKLMKSYEVGDLFSDAAYSSTTTDLRTAQAWSSSHDADYLPNTPVDKPSGLVIEIVAPAGTRAIYLPAYLGGGVDHADEYEVLLDRGTTFRVIAKTEDAEGATRALRVAIVDQTKEPIDPNAPFSAPEKETEAPEVAEAPAAPEPTVTIKGKVTETGMPKITVNEPLSFDYTAYKDIPSLTSAIASLSDENIQFAKLRGSSALFDSGDVEDLEVRVEGIVDEQGNEKMRITYKLTSWAGDNLVKSMETEGEWDDKDGIEIPVTAVDPKTGAILIKTSVYSQYRGVGTTYTADLGNATVTLRRSADFEKSSALNNYVTIDLPYDASDDDIKSAMEVGGITDVRPSTTTDFTVLAENRLMSIFGGRTDATKNLKQAAAREKTLTDIESVYGVTPADVYVTVGPGGQIETRIPDAVAQKITEKTGAKYLIHDFSMGGLINMEAVNRGIEDLQMLNPDQRKELLVGGIIDFLTGPRGGGLMATRTRWFNGIPLTGMSSDSDVGTGGADYVFFTPEDKVGKRHISGVYGNSEAELMFDAAKLYTRLDWYANFVDDYGRRSPKNNLIKSATVGAYEVMFKKRVGLESLQSMAVHRDLRDDILIELDKRGIKEIQGRPVNEVVVVAGAPEDATNTSSTAYVPLTALIKDLSNKMLMEKLNYGEQQKYLNNTLEYEYAYPPASSIQVLAAKQDFSSLLTKDENTGIYWYYHADGTRTLVKVEEVQGLVDSLGKEESDLKVFKQTGFDSMASVKEALAEYKSGKITAEQFANVVLAAQWGLNSWSALVEINAILKINPEVWDLFKKIVKGSK